MTTPPGYPQQPENYGGWPPPPGQPDQPPPDQQPPNQPQAGQFGQPPGQYDRQPGQFGQQPGQYPPPPGQYDRQPGQFGQQPGQYPPPPGQPQPGQFGQPVDPYGQPAPGSYPQHPQEPYPQPAPGSYPQQPAAYPQPQGPYPQPTSGPPTYQPVSGPPTQPVPGAYPQVSGPPTQQTFPQPGYPQAGFPQTGSFPQPGYTQQFPATAPPARPKRTRLIVGIALAVVLVLCAAGGVTGFLLLRDGGGDGQPSPAEATTAFLNAVYLQKNPTQAGRYVCSAARDADQLKRKITELTAYEKKFDRAPKFTWDPPTVESTTKKSAKVAVTVKFATDDEQVAQQRLRITAVQDKGWYVCDVQSVD